MTATEQIDWTAPCPTCGGDARWQQSQTSQPRINCPTCPPAVSLPRALERRKAAQPQTPQHPDTPFTWVRARVTDALRRATA